MQKSLVNQVVKVILKKKNKIVQEKCEQIKHQFGNEQQDQKVQGTSYNPYSHNQYQPYHPYSRYQQPQFGNQKHQYEIIHKHDGSDGNLGFVIRKEDWGNHKEGKQWINEQQRRKRSDITFNPGQFQNIHNKNIDNEQIIYIEPSLSQKKLQQLRRVGIPFEDSQFPPNRQSLVGPYGPIPDWDPIKWKKISSALPKAQIFQGKVQPNDIKQGYLGDCYFLAGLAALAERPDRIYNLFLLSKRNELNYYSMKLMYRGKWRTVDVDEEIPFVFGQPAFSKSNENQLWVILLEKAWAKMYGCYKQIQAGFPQEPLHDLTGAPIKNISLKRRNFDEQQTWSYLLKASQLQYAMVASSNPGSDANKSDSGVVQGHAYTFLHATTLNIGTQKVKLVQLRNPWGIGEFKGRWSDYDKGWNYVSPQEKKRIQFDPNHKDGTFFMSFDDFRVQFRTLTVAQIDDNASYVYSSYKDPQSKGAYFRVQIFRTGSYSFHIDKTPQRSYTGQAQQKYRYPAGWLDIGQIQRGYVKREQGFVSRRRTLYKAYDLSPGIYVAHVRIDFDQEFQKDFQVNLAIYSKYACGIRLASKNDAVEYTGDPNVDWDVKASMMHSKSYHFGKCSSHKDLKECDHHHHHEQHNNTDDIFRGWRDNPQPYTPVYPQYNKPTYPQYNRPTYPEYNRPKYPQYNKPTYPQYNRPTYPQYNKPTYPEYNKPTYPEYNKPTYPQYNRPQYNKPTYPQYNKPEYNKPTYPQQKKPIYPQYTKPQYNRPTYPQYNKPRQPEQNKLVIPQQQQYHSRNNENIRTEDLRSPNEETSMERKKNNDEHFSQQVINLIPQKGKTVRKVEIQTTQYQTTEDAQNGETIVKIQTLENKRETVKMCDDNGEIKKKVIDTEKKTEAIENQFQGETVNRVENYKEKIQVEEEKPTGSIIRKVYMNEGKTEQVEEEQNQIQQQHQNEKVQGTQKLPFNEENMSQEQKVKFLQNMEKRIFGGGRDKYAVLTKIYDDDEEQQL